MELFPTSTRPFSVDKPPQRSIFRGLFFPHLGTNYPRGHFSAEVRFSVKKELTLWSTQFMIFRRLTGLEPARRDLNAHQVDRSHSVSPLAYGDKLPQRSLFPLQYACGHRSRTCYCQCMKLKWYSVPLTREADTLIRTEIK